MKKTICIFAIITALFAFTACNLLNLPDNATPQQKKEALCQDAMQAVALGNIMLETAFGDAAVYWDRWVQGAQKGVALYCAFE